MDDKKLLKNEKSLMIFIERYSPYVCTIIRNVSNHSILECDVEEIAADVFVKVWNNFEDLKSETIRAYLAVLAKNQTIDYLRKNKREIPFEKIEMTDTINIEDETINHIEQEELKYAIDLLKPRSKELLLRFYFLYQSVSQISKEMNISETSCKTGLYRARTELKNIMYRKGYKDEK